MKEKRKPIVRLWTALLLVVAMVGAVPLPAADAADQVVTTTDDTGEGSLRQAIADAGAGDTITFDLDSYPATIALTSGELLIDEDLTITGPGAAKLTISGDSNGRVLKITAGTVNISGLTIADGLVTDVPAVGGGIHNAGTLTLSQVVVRDNRAEGPAGHGAVGGGIYSEGTLTVEASEIVSNTAVSGEWQPMPAELFAFGGGIYHTEEGALTIVNSHLEGNVARGGDGEDPGSGAGGAIACRNAGDVTVERCTIVGNRARGGDSTSGGGGRGVGGGIDVVCSLTILESILRTNVAQGGEGADGGAAMGGALYNGGETTIENSTLDDNTARGGSAAPSGDGGGAIGGGLASALGGTLTLENSTVSNNVVQGGSAKMGTPGISQGGGFHSGNSTSTLLNSTLSGNRALSDREGRGGGMYVSETSTSNVSFCTIADNRADHNGGGIHSEASAGGTGAFLKSTIVGDNDAPVGPDIFGTVNSKGWNLVGDDSNAVIDTTPPNLGTGNLVNRDPKLGPLQDNGGPVTASGQATWTQALLEGSPAINAGSMLDITMRPVNSDQRGFARPYDGVRDIGAYEWGPADLGLIKEAGATGGEWGQTIEAMPGETITFTLTISNSGYERASGVVLTDAIPVSLTNPAVVSSTVTLTDTGASPPFVWQVADIIPGYVELITLTAELVTGLPAGHVFTNTAIITTTADESDPDNNRSQAVVVVLNAPPVAVDDNYQTLPGVPLAVAAPGVLGNDHDANGDGLTAIKDTDPVSGTLVLDASGSFVYTPPDGWTGTTSFTYHAYDGAVASSSAVVTIDIRFNSVYLPLVVRNR